MIKYQLDLDDATQPLYKNWEFCVGSCHAVTALRTDWQQMLRRCRNEIGFRYVRFHGIFDDDMSVARRPMFSDEILLSFSNIDKIFDFLLSIEMKPFVELGFMPSCLASGSQTVFHYKGNTTPPRDYKQWEWLIESFLSHLIERYGRAEVRQWLFEVWNEPNLGGKGSPFGFWAANREEYFRLYKATALAVKGVDPLLRVGGPATSNNAWIPEMVSFCKENDTPLDFISTHQYPTDVIVGYGVEDSANFTNPLNLSDTEKMRTLMVDEKERKKFKKEYSVFQEHLWEHVDRGVLTEMTKRAVREAKGLPLYYTEWGSLAGLTSDGPFGASFIVKTALDGRGLAAGTSFWMFSDIVEESGQESRAFYGGFGLLTQHGIPKAPYRAFQLLHQLGSEIYRETFSDGTVDVYGVRKPESGAVQMVLVNHHSLQHPIETQTVRVVLSGGGPCVGADLQRVDETHANALSAWGHMGSPEYLTLGQEASLEGVSALVRETITLCQANGKVEFEVEVPPMGIALVTIYFNGTVR